MGRDCQAEAFFAASWLSHAPVTEYGAVLLQGASGWIEASIAQQVEAGDHHIIVLAVHDLDADHDLRPLVFHGGQYRHLPRQAPQRAE